MIFAFAPIAAFLLGISNITVPWNTLPLSVALYLLVPLVAGYFTRRALDKGDNHERLEHFFANIKTNIHHWTIGNCGFTIWISGADNFWQSR